MKVKIGIRCRSSYTAHWKYSAIHRYIEKRTFNFVYVGANRNALKENSNPADGGKIIDESQV